MENGGFKGLALFFIGFLLCEVAITGRLGSILGSIIAPSSMKEGSYPFDVNIEGVTPIGTRPGYNPGSSGTSEGGNPVGTRPGANVLSDTQIAQTAYGAGFRNSNLVIAIEVCLAESGGSVAAISASGDYGLWQINAKAHPNYSTSRLISDPSYNATAAYQISSGGANWNPWTTYKNGAYKSFATRAYQAASKYINVQYAG